VILRGKASDRYPWRPITLSQQLELTAAAHGDNLALVSGEQRLNWREVRAQARAFARALVADGVRPGDRIAIWLPNSVEWVVAWLGACYAGAVTIPVNSRYKVAEARHVLQRSAPHLLLVRHEFQGLQYHEMVPQIREPADLGDRIPSLQTVVMLGQPAGAQHLTWDQFLARGAAVADTELDTLAQHLDYTDRCMILFTSGTTGKPKGAVHTHEILRNECDIAAWMDVGPQSRLLGHMPLFHVAGAFTSVLPPLLTGAALILMTHWQPPLALELIERERIDVLFGIPTHFIDLLSAPDLADRDVSSLQSGWMGGAANPEAVVRGAFTTLGMTRMLAAYGMTETTSVTTFSRPDDPVEIAVQGKGVPISDFEVQLLDTRTGAPVGPDREGEICVRGHSVMQSYLDDEEATRQVMDSEGWFHTGDLGTIDEAGYLSITGRVSDMFIVGGSNVYPAEVELALCELAGVQQAVVAGVPDPRLGEVGCAVIEVAGDSRPSAGEVVSFCRSRLADFKVPRKVLFVNELPRLANGKVARSVAQNMAREFAAGS
jgi:fatty-acyl-CoA synthase